MSGEGYQMVFVDTPGIHKPRTQLGSYMMQAVQSGLEGIDALLMMVDVTAVGPQDRKIAEDMAKKGVPAILLLNKCDLIDNERVLPVIDQFKEMGFAEILRALFQWQTLGPRLARIWICLPRSCLN